MTSKFRPLGLVPSYKHRYYLRTGKHVNFHWVPRQQYILDGKHKSPVLTKAFSVLHYFACHSPNKLRLKYQNSYTRLVKKHMPTKCSVAYNNKYSPF